MPVSTGVCHDSPLAAVDDAVSTWPSLPTDSDVQPLADEVPTIRLPVVVARDRILSRLYGKLKVIVGDDVDIDQLLPVVEVARLIEPVRPERVVVVL